MSHLFRFYVEPDASPGDVMRLEGEEARHALRVVRVKKGDIVALFDGQGRSWRGPVSDVAKAHLDVDVESEYVEQRPEFEVTLLQAALHRDKATEEIIRRGTELGVGRFVFFQADRSERSARVKDKWRRQIIESCKQCGRLWLPTTEVASDLAGALASGEGPVLLFDTGAESKSLREIVSPGPVRLLVGPEGDFSESELEMALAQGAVQVSLGGHTLRSEVAATLAASLVLYELGALGP
jgi:16S rRNA (uracil1498-N3)-methyltransferase